MATGTGTASDVQNPFRGAESNGVTGVNTLPALSFPVFASVLTYPCLFYGGRYTGEGRGGVPSPLLSVSRNLPFVLPTPPGADGSLRASGGSSVGVYPSLRHVTQRRRSHAHKGAVGENTRPFVQGPLQGQRYRSPQERIPLTVSGGVTLTSVASGSCPIKTVVSTRDTRDAEGPFRSTSRKTPPFYPRAAPTPRGGLEVGQGVLSRPNPLPSTGPQVATSETNGRHWDSESQR